VGEEKRHKGGREALQAHGYGVWVAMMVHDVVEMTLQRQAGLDMHVDIYVVTGMACTPTIDQVYLRSMSRAFAGYR
jgi:hypothetical protein